MPQLEVATITTACYRSSGPGWRGGVRRRGCLPVLECGPRRLSEASGARVVGLLLEYRYQSPLRVLELLLALIHFKVGTQVMSLLASAWVNRGLLNQAFVIP